MRSAAEEARQSGRRQRTAVGLTLKLSLFAYLSLLAHTTDCRHQSHEEHSRQMVRHEGAQTSGKRADLFGSSSPGWGAGARARRAASRLHWRSDDDGEETDGDNEEEGSSRAAELTESIELPTSTTPLPSSRADNLTESIERLGTSSKQLETHRNTSVVENGRKFDQVRPVECVDERFYALLQRDLSLVAPDRRRDFYGAYYDQEFAKAVEAAVDASGPDGMAQPKGHLLGRVDRLWREASQQFRRRAAELDPRSPREALDNRKYLLGQIEALKLELLAGEEALVVVHSRVKKLNQAAGLDELYDALCSCISGRAGRAALMLMNELFVDRDSAQLLSRPEAARERAGEAARDTAEFCAYWFVDTLRAEFLQKPRGRRLVAELQVGNKTALRRHHPRFFGVLISGVTSLLSSIGGALSAAGGAVVAGAQAVGPVVNVASGVVGTVSTVTSLVNQFSSKPEPAPSSPAPVNLPPMTYKPATTSQPTTTSLPANTSQVATTGMPVKSIKTTTTSLPMNSTKKATTRPPADSTKLTTTSLPVKGNSTMTTRLPANDTKTVTKTDPPANKTNAVTGADRNKHDQVGVSDGRKDEDRHHDAEKRRRKEEKRGRHKKRLDKRAAELDNEPFSTPFDLPDIYADIDDPAEIESSGMLRNFIRHNYFRARPRRAADDSAQGGATEEQTQVNASSPAESELQLTARAAKCARSGFERLLVVGQEQNKLMYATNHIPPAHGYVRALRNAFVEAFEDAWPERLRHWAKSPAAGVAAQESSSVDEEIDGSLESAAGSYERGAQIGFTAGSFVGTKAAHQWPDPAELNTFTYDSLFLAGVGRGHSAAESAGLERRIVAEAAKRAAFTEANRAAFAAGLHSAYLNGAYIVPLWGVLHAQRAVAKQAAKEGAKTGSEAASRAAAELAPKAAEFFRAHQRQRQLAAPYRQSELAGQMADERWAGISNQMSEARLEGDLNRNITELAIDCGQKSGTLMGALLGLLVVPEAFETYARFRGSLEALESEFNQFKLGALRGYELGENWAYLNYTTELSQNLAGVKARMASNKSQPAEESTGAANTNNIFQFMVPNYGTHLIANHSRAHLLRLRSVPVDEQLVRELRRQTGDLNAPDGAGGEQETAEDEGEPQSAGELAGEFSSADSERKKPIKFVLLELGPRLELADELEAGRNATDAADSPLSVALAKLDKLFIRFNVAGRRRTGPHDGLAELLNGGQTDQADGYLSGSFSKLGSRQPTDGEWDLGAEGALLDELFERIERAQPEEGTVELVKRLMSPSTVAPRKPQQASSTPEPQAETGNETNVEPGGGAETRDQSERSADQ